MSDKIGEFIPVFGWVIHSQQLEMIGGRLVWIIFLLAKLNLSLADKWGQTWISMDRDAGFFCFCFFPFSKMQPDCQSLVKKNLCFWETQTLSSVFSIRTLKIIKQPCNTMSHEDSYFGGVYLKRMPDAYFYFFSLISSSVCLLSSCVSPSCGWPYLILWDVQPAFGVHLTLCVYTFILRLF